MSMIELSAYGKSPLIPDYILREDIDLSSAPADGLHYGVQQIPLGVLIEAIHVKVITAVAGDSVASFEVSISNDQSVFASRDNDIAVDASGFGFFADVRSRFGVEDATSTIKVFTKKATKAAAATTSGVVRVTLYGRQFLAY